MDSEQRRGTAFGATQLERLAYRADCIPTSCGRRCVLRSAPDEDERTPSTRQAPSPQRSPRPRRSGPGPPPQPPEIRTAVEAFLSQFSV